MSVISRGRIWEIWVVTMSDCLHTHALSPSVYLRAEDLGAKRPWRRFEVLTPPG
jgi:hypothetical protein